MLLTCRSTVRSLSTSSAAIARFVSPAATSRSTSQLASGQRRAGGRAPEQRVDARVGRRAELRERVARGVELQRGGVLVAERAARDADELARPRAASYGHRERAPAAPGVAQVGERRRARRRARASTAPRAWATSASSSSRRERGRDPLELRARARRRRRDRRRRAGSPRAAGSSRARCERLGGLRQRAPDRGARGLARRPARAAAARARAAARRPPRLAARYAASAAASSPCSRCTSACAVRAPAGRAARRVAGAPRLPTARRPMRRGAA